MGTRFNLFKQVLSEAAKRPPLSPAFYAYKLALSDAERREAYAAMTATDRDAIIEDAMKLMRARDEAAAVERRAMDAKIASWESNINASRRSAEAARIAGLPAAARRRAKVISSVLRVFSLLGNSLGWLLVALFLLGNIVFFILSLIYRWYAWLLLASICLAIYLLVMLVVHWSRIMSVLKALPSAIFAAIHVEEQSGLINEVAPNAAAPADQKAPLSGR